VSSLSAPRNSVALPLRNVRGPRRVLRVIVLGVLGFCGALVVGFGLALATGHQAFTIVSGSMEPAIGTGDVVVVDKIAPLDARVGDVISFRDPENASRILTHRVTKMRATGDSVRFVTRGDANTGVETWGIPVSGTIGRVDYRIPKIGYVANRIGSRFGRFGFVVIPAVLLALTELWRIWRPASVEGGHEARS